nr:DUF2255 family protein [Streptomyces fulvoviolaceus]
MKGRNGPWFRGAAARRQGRISSGGVHKDVGFQPASTPPTAVSTARTRASSTTSSPSSPASPRSASHPADRTGPLKEGSRWTRCCSATYGSARASPRATAARSPSPCRRRPTAPSS